MNLIFLTKSSVPIIGHIAVILGLIMDGLFRVTANLGVTNIGLSIILFTLIINLLMWPLTVKQQKSSRLMSVMQPELQAIQKKYRGKTDNVSVMRMQNETKAVYAKYGTSMTGGCVFLLIQMPILFALYQVIYRIPAYVPSVYAVFKNAAEPVMQQPGYIEVLNGIGEKIRPALVEGATLNQVIDFLYRFTPTQWASLEAAFPSIAPVLADTAVAIGKMNYFLGINLSVPPFQGFMPNPAWIIPIAAALVQWYSTKLMTAGTSSSRSNDSDNPMAQQMQTMNTMMPMMSLVFCFTLPAGIGLYWVASGLCRMVQQMIINHQLDSMNIEEIVKANMEKANAKAIEKGGNAQQLKSRTEKTVRGIQNMEREAEEEERSMKEKMSRNAKVVADSTAYYQKNAKPGSLASKANMVAMYNDRQMEKKNKKKKDVAADAEKTVKETAADVENAVNAAETAAAETVNAVENAAAEAVNTAETAGAADKQEN